MQIPHALIFNLVPPNTQGIRLGFASCNKNELTDNVKRLKQLLTK
jgi:hypothetical protein